MQVVIMSEINVLYSFDNNFWRMAAVSIVSLMESKNPDTHINVHCMVAPHTHGWRKIKKIIGQGGKLIWHVVPKHKNPYAGVDYSRWSPVIFYRLFAHEIFTNIDKLLYLDSDTLINDDLTELYNTDISKYAFGAVRDMALINIPKHPAGEYVKEFKEKYLKHDLYINSGVLLLNLNYLRTTQSPWKTDCTLKYPDQDILNVVFDGKILELPLRYNTVSNGIYDKKFPLSERNFIKKKIHIEHFYAACKPYIYHPLNRETYAKFSHTARKIGLHPDDFIQQDIKRHKKSLRKHKHDSSTGIPFVKIDKRGHLRLFGMKI